MKDRCHCRWSVVLLLAFVITTALVSCGSSNHGGGPLTNPPAPSDSDPTPPESVVYYTLPRTVLQVTVPVTRKEGRKGRCTDHRESEIACGTAGTKKLYECLGLPKKHDPRTIYEVGDPVLGSRAEPDPEAVFNLPLAGSKLDKRYRELQLSESGILSGGESKVESKRLSLATGIFKSLAGIAGALLAEGDASEDECKAAAMRVLDLRARRQLLLDSVTHGQAIPVETAKLVLGEIERAEKATLEIFGSSKDRSFNVVCELVPTLADIVTDVSATKPSAKSFSIEILGVSEAGVICPKGDDNSTTCHFGEGRRVACFVPEDARATAPHSGDGKVTRARLELAYVPEQLSEKLRAKEAHLGLEKRDNSFFYRIPSWADARVQIIVEKNGQKESVKTVTDESRLIAQLGLINALPGEGNDHYTVMLHPETGALKKVTASAEPLATTDVTGALDAVKGLVEADRAADDELVQLERQRKILEEQKKIRDLLKELATATDGAQ